MRTSHSEVMERAVEGLPFSDLQRRWISGVAARVPVCDASADRAPAAEFCRCGDPRGRRSAGVVLMPVAFADLAQTCAPTVQVETLAAIVSLEGGFSPFAIRINSGLPLTDQPGSKAEAIEVATTLIAQRQDVDLGLGGINADDLRRLQLTVADAFDPCLNLKATARLLDGYYRVAISGGAHPAQASTITLQAYYGRGDTSVGEMAAYDTKVRAEAKRLAQQLSHLAIGTIGASAAKAVPTDPPVSEPTRAPPNSPPPISQREAKPAPWDVFAAGRRSSVLVFQNQQSE